MGRGRRADDLDVVIVGGGHNGLVAAGLLAGRGARVLLLERRDRLGGATVTEEPWGPGWRVSALSYVVSLLHPRVVRELDLARHGFRVLPQGPYFAPRADGPPLRLRADPARRRDELRRLAPGDADALERWDAWLAGLAAAVAPVMTAPPPTFGSHRPADLADVARFFWRLRGFDTRTVADLTRLFTDSVADLLEERFQSEALRGVLAVSGVIGTWGGPRRGGSAYVMLHHKLGPALAAHLGEDPAAAAWGFPVGGMGGLAGALAAAARLRGVELRTGVAVERILTRAGRVVGVATAEGTEIPARVVVAATHPQLTFLHQLDPAELPDEFVADLRRWRSRSGVVKVNVGVDRLPAFRGIDGFDPEVHGGTIVLADSIDELEGAFREAEAGRAATRPFADVCIPSVVDDTLAPPGHHVVSMFTQWVPHTWAAGCDRTELEAYADRVIARMDEVAPGFAASVVHRQVIGPHDLATTYGLVGGNIFHGELTPSQLFHLRPAPGFTDHRSPVRGLYQASSATHGGGGVTGIPGLAAAAAVLADHRRGR